MKVAKISIAKSDRVSTYQQSVSSGWERYGYTGMFPHSRYRKRRSKCSQRTISLGRGLCLIAVFVIMTLNGEVFAVLEDENSLYERTISILGVTMSGGQPIGTVTSLVLTFHERTDRTGLMIGFRGGIGRLSPMAQTSVQQAIYRAAHIANLSTDSWTVTVSVPNPVTIHGDSLSAMVALTVIALAKGDAIMDDCIITGGIAADGHISKAGGLSWKLAAAGKAHIRQVLVPDEFDPTETDWQTPFMMQVSRVDSVQQAYQTLTGSPIK